MKPMIAQELCREQQLLGRRQLLQRSAAAGLALVGFSLFGATTALAKTGKESIAATRAGRVRGVLTNGVHIFKGIPYGASTTGEARFAPPHPPASWSGVRDAYEFGPRAYQVPASFSYAGVIANGRSDVAARAARAYFPEGRGLTRPESEDCLVLNIWTPALRDGKSRPVMVWLHGGGFVLGSGAWSVNDGSALAQEQDVVVVSINHRLNVFGYLYLAELGGDRYAESGNTGSLDIVAALEWVRDNIQEFGGDPGNVTIFGESGGGKKVCTLMAMPKARGLFHKAIVMSGPGYRVLTRDTATDMAERVLHQLGLSRARLKELHRLPADRLRAAADGIGGWDKPGIFYPVMDKRSSLPGHPFGPVALDISADIPLMIGTTEYELTAVPHLFGTNSKNEDFLAMTETTLRQKLQDWMAVGGEDVGKLWALYQRSRPKATGYDLFMLIASESMFRIPSITIAERKAAVKRAPVYLYQFAWQTPKFGGLLKSAHGYEVPFAFNSLHLTPDLVGEGPEQKALARRMSTTWASFARTGNPDHPDLPHWPAYDMQARDTMIFDNTCKVVSDPDGEGRKLLQTLPPHPWQACQRFGVKCST